MCHALHIVMIKLSSFRIITKLKKEALCKMNNVAHIVLQNKSRITQILKLNITIIISLKIYF